MQSWLNSLAPDRCRCISIDWGLNKMADILQTAFLNAFSCTNSFVFWFEIYLNLFQGPARQSVIVSGNNVAPTKSLPAPVVIKFYNTMWYQWATMSLNGQIIKTCGWSIWLRIGQFDRYNMCIETFWSISDISYCVLHVTVLSKPISAFHVLLFKTHNHTMVIIRLEYTIVKLINVITPLKL